MREGGVKKDLGFFGEWFGCVFILYVVGFLRKFL